MTSGTESFECENREQGTSQNRNFKLAVCSAFALGMVVGTVGLLAGLGLKAEVSHSALSSALWSTPKQGTLRVHGATRAATKTITGAELASVRGSRPATMTNMEELNEDSVVKASGSSYCARRDALARASAMAAAAIGAPSLVFAEDAGTVAETVGETVVNSGGDSSGDSGGESGGGSGEVTVARAATVVKMGGDKGELLFVPSEITICKGDKVTWINNKAGPHNVVFNSENVPSGIDAEKISMEGFLDEEGQTFEQIFDTPGTYGYRCEPHAWTTAVKKRRGGMIGTIEVKA